MKKAEVKVRKRNILLNEAVKKARKVEDSLEDGIRLSNQDLYLVSMLNEIDSLEGENEQIKDRVKDLLDLLVDCSLVLSDNNFRGDLQDSISDELAANNLG